MQRIALTRAKARFSGLVDRLIHLKEHIVITKRGKPVAALIPYEIWESLEVGLPGAPTGLAGVPPFDADVDAEIDRMVAAIYEARKKAKARRAVI